MSGIKANFSKKNRSQFTLIPTIQNLAHACIVLYCMLIMKDFSSFFLLKNSFGSVGSKKRKGMRSNFCNGNCSTSTLNQNNPSPPPPPRRQCQDSNYNSCMFTPSPAAATQRQTLEEMIWQLELEELEAAARKSSAKAKLNLGRTRLSSVDNTASENILMSARDALNQYPRFSLDGKDARYRSSFRNLDSSLPRKSVCCDRGLAHRLIKSYHQEKKPAAICCFPPTVAGQPVIWCAPGVVAKLMGLDAIPVPLKIRKGSVQSNKEELGYIINGQNLRRRAERHEKSRERTSVATMDKILMPTSCSSSNQGYCTLNPVAVDAANAGGWPTRRFF